MADLWDVSGPWKDHRAAWTPYENPAKRPNAGWYERESLDVNVDRQLPKKPRHTDATGYEGHQRYYPRSSLHSERPSASFSRDPYASARSATPLPSSSLQGSPDYERRWADKHDSSPEHIQFEFGRHPQRPSQAYAASNRPRSSKALPILPLRVLWRDVKKLRGMTGRLIWLTEYRNI